MEEQATEISSSGREGLRRLCLCIHSSRRCLLQEVKALATRNCSELVLNAIAGEMAELMGGSADLTGSNLTSLKVKESPFAGELSLTSPH
jgi:transketolase